MLDPETLKRVFEGYETGVNQSVYKTVGLNYTAGDPVIEDRFSQAYGTAQYYYLSSGQGLGFTQGENQVITSSIKVGPSDLNNVKVGHWVEWSGTVAQPTGTHIVRISSSSVLALGLVISMSNLNTATVLKSGYVYDPTIIGYQTGSEGNAYNYTYTLYLADYGSSSTDGMDGQATLGSVSPAIGYDGSTVASLYVNPTYAVE